MTAFWAAEQIGISDNNQKKLGKAILMSRV